MQDPESAPAATLLRTAGTGPRAGLRYLYAAQTAVPEFARSCRHALRRLWRCAG